MKKNMVENVVPIVIAVKHNMESNHSPLLRPLLAFLRDVIADYKDEVNGMCHAGAIAQCG